MLKRERVRWILVAMGWVSFVGGWGLDRVVGQEKIDPVRSTLSAESLLVPQTMLSLVHTPQVLDEIGIPRAEREKVEGFLRTVDGEWWRGRIRPDVEHRKSTALLEDRLARFLSESFGPHVIKRLRQLEWQSQGVRALIRPEVVGYLGITETQLESLTVLFGVTEETRKRAYPKPGQVEEAAAERLARALEEEPKKVVALLSERQRERLGSLIGKPFDTSKLKRIYPLAPELIPSSEWVHEPVALEGLRGKVLLVHFYAFQCGNCKKNFPIYQRWQRELSSSGVQVIGIQSPETSAERDADKVRRDAKENGFEFPVLIDTEMKNWDAWGNTMWPTVYVVDKRGYIRLWWQGELNWEGATGDKQIEELVTELLREEDGTPESRPKK
ncbi:Thiol-disulfide oxidoreductase YkuV [Pirellula sp. SH-Sr6A]|uniref:redoxin domain-containing protein n=1 Tax=Pirellula sp. SH-Sr6A TaxID=1632865 RepID=UPI00078EAD07|nr:redoxin domain-containing protein [Pirellula sp. SH-Sr6A]AMV33319.1 Thiol-disulfide oxidoreductase YkuV [Pirellula sp. SH-Sr6A]